MRNHFGVRRQMRLLSEATDSGPSPQLETRLLSAFRKEVHRRRRQRLVISTAALLIVALGAIFSMHEIKRREFRASEGRGSLVRTYGPAVLPGGPAASDTNDFVPLPYAQSDIPLEGAIVVRVDIPESQIRFAGRTMTRLPKGRHTVEAELLVGLDGVPRAMRVLR